ncbi:hypothetical protein IscW_ISCW014437 [Ixodes scapularis]|uniref:MARVEL domain-containing protein n=1 Tax=Ixodes scapularis TaxID=6945 RepID=B7QHB1_IXOSC|nr:hypothetical protein IscW_ISCW014437 [Ixodes scapularis]|eukprot:XP_002414568.1 hypothetical protein IscW_ISCW014437 [Ixodes scapularis]
MTTAPVGSPTPALPAEASPTLQQTADTSPSEGEGDLSDVPQRIKVDPGYMTTGQGILTTAETVGAACLMVLYLLMSSNVTIQWYAHVTFLVSFTYCLNNLLIIIAGISSPSTQFHLPQTAFYVLYHGLAGFVYVVGAALFHTWHKTDELPYKSVTGYVEVGLGIVHCFHTLVNFIK